jgi:hypothetical protein
LSKTNLAQRKINGCKCSEVLHQQRHISYIYLKSSPNCSLHCVFCDFQCHLLVLVSFGFSFVDIKWPKSTRQIMHFLSSQNSFTVAIYCYTFVYVWTYSKLTTCQSQIPVLFVAKKNMRNFSMNTSQICCKQEKKCSQKMETNFYAQKRKKFESFIDSIGSSIYHKFTFGFIFKLLQILETKLFERTWNCFFLDHFCTVKRLLSLKIFLFVASSKNRIRFWYLGSI